MKKFKYLMPVLSLLLLGVWACEEDQLEIAPLSGPSNLVVNADISQDGSGLVSFSASAGEAMTYHYYFGVSASEAPVVVPSGNISYSYRSSGTYQVRVVAYGAGGISTNAEFEVEVEVTYEPPASLLQTLTNGSSRVWVWKKDVAAHLGVGPEFNDDGSPGDGPIWYAAGAFEKESEGCLYNDRITFTLNPDNSVAFKLENQGATYFHVDEAVDALGVERPPFDQCFDYDVSGSDNAAVGFFETGSGIPNSTGIGMEIGNNGFMSYFLNSSTYEILSISDEELHVRTVQDVDGFRLAWYQKFIAEDAIEVTEPEYQLVWEETFDVDGAPNPDNWGYDIGTGNDGWGNAEVQFYTDRSDNVIVENGVLRITAKRENYSGSNFTSARIKTENKFEFTYGRIEVRAKLPTGGGTWPAIWMLGADFETVGWPTCGEIDIMEHVGNNQDFVQAAIHSPSSFGDTQNKGSLEVPGVSDEFHVYAAEWTDEGITFFVDDQSYYVYAPEVKNDDTYPFNKDFFLILNIAMGGTLGGEIAGDFVESSMEVDYVKVYQLQ